MHTVTKKWLNANRTKRGGWTNAQWYSIGVTNNLMKMKGWKELLIGSQITDQQKLAFEQASGIYAGKDKNLAKKKLTLIELIEEVKNRVLEETDASEREADLVDYFIDCLKQEAGERRIKI